MIDISFIIVSWNAKEFLRKCLVSIEKNASGLSTETIVIDNLSSDGSPEMVRKEFPGVNLIEAGANLGFARANNLGIARSRGRYLCLLNSDVEVLEGTMRELCSRMDEAPSIGIAGPKVLNADMTLQPTCRRAPSIWNSFARIFALYRLVPGSAMLGDQLIYLPSGENPVRAEVLTGCFWFVRRNALAEVGPLDERFFMYGEDMDWCKRYIDAGWQVVYMPTARVVHYGGASSANAPVRFFVEMHRANLQYWQKHHSGGAVFVYLCTLWAHNIVRMIGNSILRMRPGGKGGDETAFKVRRSLSCLKWLAAEGWDFLRAGEPQDRSLAIEETPLHTGAGVRTRGSAE